MTGDKYYKWQVSVFDNYVMSNREDSSFSSFHWKEMQVTEQELFTMRWILQELKDELCESIGFGYQEAEEALSKIITQAREL